MAQNCSDKEDTVDNEADDERDDEDEDEEEGELASLAGSGSGGAPAQRQLLERHASMACMWHTTVPQSLTPLSEFGLGGAGGVGGGGGARGGKAAKGSTRHAPTRRSLRHSRMLVAMRNYNAGELSGGEKMPTALLQYVSFTFFC